MEKIARVKSYQEEEEHLTDVEEKLRTLLKDGANTFMDFKWLQPELPDFFDEKKFLHGQRMFYNNVFTMMIAKLCGLLSLFAVPSIKNVLAFTKQSGTPCAAYHRYVSTILHTWTWYGKRPGIEKQFLDSLKIVRKKHCVAFRRSCEAGLNRVTQLDMALAQFGFMGFTLLAGDYLGVNNSSEELEGLIHFWHVVGSMLGMEDKYNLCTGSVEETRALCRRVLDDVFLPSLANENKDFNEMSRTLIKGLWPLNPYLDSDAFIVFTLTLASTSATNNNHSLKIDTSHLSWYGRFILNLQIIVHKYLLPTTCWWSSFFRAYFNGQMRLAVYLTEHLPFLAFWTYGIKNSYVRFGYGVAVTLAIFEAKRFFMLILEIFAEWQIIRFAGGLQPVVFTLVNVSVGLPTALITVRSIRDRKVPRCCAETRRSLKCLLIAIAICAILNAATLVSIGYHISVRQESLIDIFNNSMRLYVSTASYKYAIDEIQFIFQCCGHTSYTDWFQFDWQGVDYASREEMAAQSRISDEEYRDRGVPFSCCDLRAMAPCEHTEIQGNDVKTINTNGCAQVMNPVLLRIVIVAYVMTSTLVIIQIFLAFLIAKIIRRLLFGTCRLYHPPEAFANESSSVSLDSTSSETERRNSSTSPSNWERRSPRETKKPDKSRKRKIKRVSSSSLSRRVQAKNKAREDADTSSSATESSPVNKPSDRTRQILAAAKIKPSTHEEHTIRKKLILTTLEKK